MPYRYLKEQDPAIRVLLADPTGSSLLRRVTHGVCYAPQQSERTVRKHRYDSVVEGVGLDRVTANFALGLQAGLDGGFHIADQEVVDTAHWLLRHEGLFVGSSSALNVAAAVRAAHALRRDSQQDGGERVRVVTVVCDSGSRHLSRLWNPDYISTNYGLSWPEEDRVPSCLQLFSHNA
jgi:cysteine synthase A